MAGPSILLLLVVLPLALLPTFIAIKKEHPYKVPIILVNIFGGLLFGIGWLVALVWCFIEPTKPQALLQSANEIEKLHVLKEKGVISQQEFDAKKKAFLET